MPTPQQIEVLKKYKVMLPDGSLRQCNLRSESRPGGPPMGQGPIMSQQAIDRLCDVDTTPDAKWTDWIFFQAGGGQSAKDATADALNQIRDRFIDERTNGFTRPDTGQYVNPVPRAEAEARWAANENRFRDVLSVCDQDEVKKLRTFGYFREWPGNANKYQQVVDAVERFLRLYSKLQEMNRELQRDGGDLQPETPEAIQSVEAMNEITAKVDRYFASKVARTDIRIADNKPIYEDDVIVAIAPLTYAAAVKYGHDAWPWASRKGFEDVLGGDPGRFNFHDEWKTRTTRGSAFVHLTFKAPTPAWVARRDGNWELKDLHDLALELDGDVTANSNPDDWQVFDQENRNTMTIAQIKQMILAEPTRAYDNEDETPIGRGGNVYQTPEEAQRVADSLDRAVNAVKKWIVKFDRTKIKKNALSLD